MSLLTPRRSLETRYEGDFSYANAGAVIIYFFYVLFWLPLASGHGKYGWQKKNASFEPIVKSGWEQRCLLYVIGSFGFSSGWNWHLGSAFLPRNNAGLDEQDALDKPDAHITRFMNPTPLSRRYITLGRKKVSRGARLVLGIHTGQWTDRCWVDSAFQLCIRPLPPPLLLPLLPPPLLPPPLFPNPLSLPLRTRRTPRT